MRVPLTVAAISPVFQATNPASYAVGINVEIFVRGADVEKAEPVAVYSDETGGELLVQPLVTDEAGRIEGQEEQDCWVEEGSYDVLVEGTVNPWEAVRGDNFEPPSKIIRGSGARSARRYVDDDVRWAADYGITFNGDDDTEGWEEAIPDLLANDWTLHCPDGHSGISSPLVAESVTHALAIKGEGPGRTVLEDGCKGSAMLEVRGSGITSLTTIKAVTAVGDTSFKPASLSGLAAGQILLLVDTTQELFESVEGGSKKVVVGAGGESIRIREISGENVIVEGKLNWAYAEGAKVYVLNPMVAPMFEGFDIEFLYPGEAESAAARGILVNYANNILFKDIRCIGLDGPGIYMNYTSGFRVLTSAFHNMRESVINGYGIVAGRAVSHGLVMGCEGRKGRHLFTTAAGTEMIVPQDIAIHAPVITEHAFAAIDTHPGSRFIVVYNPLFSHGAGATSQGVQLRGADSGVVNPTVFGAWRGVALHDGADRCFVMGGLLDNCDQAIVVDDSNDSKIGGDLVISRPKTNGVIYLKQNPAWAGHMVRQYMDNVQILGDPSDYAIRQETANAGCYIGSNVKIPEATRKMIGVSAVPSVTAAAEVAEPV